MATNGDIPAGDTEMAECDGEEIVTMMDVLKEQQDFEDDANAVLGGSDEKECTYSQGYIKRQAIYACMTCCPDSKDDPSKRAGFCLACSLSCHENHDLIELYTKRNFRCDCGNPKFKSPCQFTPNKPELNDENVYNQNFVGLYCSCSKPYEQESTLDDEMIQCIICEDWWHATHLDAVVPANDQYSEMVCKLCMAKNEFLHDYSDLVVNVETDVDVIGNGKNDDKHSNGTLTDEKLNGTDKVTNDIEEDSGMETSTTEVTPESNNKDIVSTTEDATVDGEEAVNELEKPVVSDENETNAAMDTDETDKASEVVPEVNSEDKIKSTVDKSDENEPLKDKEDETASKEKVEETSDTTDDKTEESNDTTTEKTDVSVSADNSESTDKTEEANEGNDDAESTKMADQSEPSVENNVSSTENDEIVAEDTKKSPENVDTVESKVTEDQEKETDTVKEKDNVKTESPSEETDKYSAETNENTTEAKPVETSEDVEMNGKDEDNKVSEDSSKDTSKVDEPANGEKESNSTNESPSEETDKSSAETNENTTNEAKPVETSEDVEMNGKDEEDNKVSEDSSKDTSKVDEPANGEKESNSTNDIESGSNEIVPEIASIENKRKMDDITDDVSFKKPKLDKCFRPKGVKRVHKGATFWPSTLRQKLCTCSECINMYKDLSVLFLTDSEDTVFAYETLGKERTAGKPNQYEKGMEALCSLGRIQQIDALTEYNKMRDKLLTFLQSFKDKKEIVTEDDIKSFFAGMKPEKRMDGVYFCR